MQEQALAAIKIVISTSIFKEKQNATNIVEDIERSFNLPFTNNMKHWKMDGLYQQDNTIFT